MAVRVNARANMVDEVPRCMTAVAAPPCRFVGPRADTEELVVLSGTRAGWGVGVGKVVVCGGSLIKHLLEPDNDFPTVTIFVLPPFPLPFLTPFLEPG